MAAITCTSSRKERRSPLGFFVFLVVAAILAALIFANFSRHSDVSHNPRDDRAQAVITGTLMEFEIATNNSGGPGNSQRLLCAVVAFADGMKHYVIWMADSLGSNMGSVAVYNDSGWVSAYGGKLKDDFIRGNPNGAISKKIKNCDEFFPPNGMIFAP